MRSPMARCGSRPNWSTTGSTTSKRSGAGRQERATLWPTGFVRAATSPDSWSGRVRPRPCLMRQPPRIPPPEEHAMHIHKEIDTRGLNCPLPILKAKKSLNEMQSGELLKVVSTDAGSVRDFQAFARQTGNDLVEQQTIGTDFIHVLRRR